MTFVGQMSRIAIQIVGVVVLARLLSPSEFGLVAMVMVFIGLGEIFRDAGLSNATIQAKTVSQQQKSNLFWINTGVGFVLTVIFFLASPLIAAFFARPELTDISQWLSLIFVLNALSAQARAQLNRNFSFGRLAAIDIASQVLGLLSAIITAVHGFSYWALVVQQVGQSLFSLVFLLILNRWIPSLPKAWNETIPLLKFGGALFASELINYASRRTDRLLIGIRFGTEALGSYDRASQLLRYPLVMINAPATRVAFPILSKLQSEEVRFTAYILSAQRILLHPILFILFFIACSGGNLVSIILGEQWGVTSILFQIIAIGGCFQMADLPTYWTFLARGKAKELMHLSFVTGPLFAIGICAASIWTVETVAISYSVGFCFIWLFNLFWSKRLANAPARVMLAISLRALLAYGCAAGTAFALDNLLWVQYSHMTRVFSSAGVMVIVVACLSLWPSFRRDLAPLLKFQRVVLLRFGSAK